MEPISNNAQSSNNSSPNSGTPSNSPVSPTNSAQIPAQTTPSQPAVPQPQNPPSTSIPTPDAVSDNTAVKQPPPPKDSESPEPPQTPSSTSAKSKKPRNPNKLQNLLLGLLLIISLAVLATVGFLILTNEPASQTGQDTNSENTTGSNDANATTDSTDTEDINTDPTDHSVDQGSDTDTDDSSPTPTEEGKVVFQFSNGAQTYELTMDNPKDYKYVVDPEYQPDLGRPAAVTITIREGVDLLIFNTESIMGIGIYGETQGQVEGDIYRTNYFGQHYVMYDENDECEVEGFCVSQTFMAYRTAYLQGSILTDDGVELTAEDLTNTDALVKSIVVEEL